jgi:hypothetical protein
MASRSKPAIKQGKVVTQDKKSNLGHAKKTGGADITKPHAFKKINPPELPTNDINCGRDISHIKNAIVAYCQKCGLGTGGEWNDEPVKKCNAGKRLFYSVRYQKRTSVLMLK